MKVLVACEEWQEVCKAFRKFGHEAYSCDIQECSGGHPEWHIRGDAREVLFCTKWDLVIAHPPCKYLSNAGAVRLFHPAGVLDKDRYINGLKGKEFFMMFYWYGKCGNKICIENPVPSSVYQLPKCTQIIQPYEFGEPYSKKTYLWEFGLQPLKPTSIVEPICSWVSGGSKKADGSKRENQGTVYRDSRTRSKTFRGIAKAMAEQWGV